MSTLHRYSLIVIPNCCNGDCDKLDGALGDEQTAHSRTSKQIAFIASVSPVSASSQIGSFANEARASVHKVFHGQTKKESKMQYLKSRSTVSYIIVGVLLVIVGVGIGALTTKANRQTTKTTATTTKPIAGAINSTCSKTDAVDIASKTYMAQNNLWNGAATGQQCIKVDTGSGAFTVAQANNTLPTNGAPASYPSIYKGCHWGSCTTNSRLPIQVSKLASLKSQWNIKTAPGAWDSAYDIWFNSTPTANGQPDGAELMVWINHSGKPQPFGSQNGSASIAGAKWSVWSAYQGWNTISYVDSTPTQSVDFDLKHFITDAVARGQIKSNWYLTAVEAGFELWQGGAGMTSNAFSVSPVAAS